jgi:hypothetical protein
MRYTIYFWAFAKRAQISFGDVSKGNLLTFEKKCKKQSDYRLLTCNPVIKHFLEVVSGRPISFKFLPIKSITHGRIRACAIHEPTLYTGERK